MCGLGTRNAFYGVSGRVWNGEVDSCGMGSMDMLFYTIDYFITIYSTIVTSRFAIFDIVCFLFVLLALWFVFVWHLCYLFLPFTFFSF